MRDLSGKEGPNVPHFFVGDEGFAPTEIYFVVYRKRITIQLPTDRDAKI